MGNNGSTCWAQACNPPTMSLMRTGQSAGRRVRILSTASCELLPRRQTTYTAKERQGNQNKTHQTGHNDNNNPHSPPMKIKKKRNPKIRRKWQKSGDIHTTRVASSLCKSGGKDICCGGARQIASWPSPVHFSLHYLSTRAFKTKKYQSSNNPPLLLSRPTIYLTKKKSHK